MILTPKGEERFESIWMYNEAHPGTKLPERDNLLLILGISRGGVLGTTLIVAPRDKRDKGYLDRVVGYIEEFEKEGLIESV